MTLTLIPVDEERPIKDYCSATRAAELRGVAASSVYHALRSGTLTAYSAYGTTVLLRSDVDAWKVRAKNGSRKETKSVPEPSGRA